MFHGKVVLLTGASSGIGAQTALDFSSLGASLVITGRNRENLQKVKERCEELSPNKLEPLTIVCDLNVDSEAEQLIQQTIQRFKRLDVLVNNAGIFASGSIETTSLEQYDNVMGINMRSPYHLTMLAVPHLIKSKGNIVNISSGCGLRSFPNFLAYCISKATLDQFTRCVALELGPKGVRVNAVNPGTIVTGIHLKGAMTEKEYELSMQRCAESHALRRLGESAEVSAAITFLASDAAKFVTGVTFPVDGGRHVMSTYIK